MPGKEICEFTFEFNDDTEARIGAIVNEAERMLFAGWDLETIRDYVQAKVSAEQLVFRIK